MAPRFVEIADPIGDGMKFFSSGTGNVLASLVGSLPSNATSRVTLGVTRALEALLSAEALELLSAVPLLRGPKAWLLVAGTLLALLRTVLLAAKTASILREQGRSTKLQKSA